MFASRLPSTGSSGTSVAGIDAEYQSERLTGFGEIARSQNKAMAGVAGVSFGLGKKGSILFLYRDYSSGFKNMHAGGFGEHDDTNNERGLDAGIQLTPLRWITVSASIDHFHFPSGTYLIPLPSSGRDLLVQADVSLNPRLDLSGRYSTKLHEERSPVLDLFGRDSRFTIDREERHLRLTAVYQAGPDLRLKIRLEGSALQQTGLSSGERGILLYQDIQFKTAATGMTIEGRLLFFQTNSYDSRIYEYENDLQGVFSNPPLYGKGRRWYILARYRPGPNITVSLKYSETQKEGVTSLGSGPAEVAGDQDTRVAAQIDLGL